MKVGWLCGSERPRAHASGIEHMLGTCTCLSGMVRLKMCSFERPSWLNMRSFELLSWFATQYPVSQSKPMGCNATRCSAKLVLAHIASLSSDLQK